MAAPGERLRLYCWFPFLPLSFLLWLLAFPQCSCELLDHLILPSLTHSLWSCTLNDCGQGLLSPGCGEVKPCVLRVVQMAAAVAGEGRSVRLLTVESRDWGWKSIHHLDILFRCRAVTGHHRLNHYFLSSGRTGSQYQVLRTALGLLTLHLHGRDRRMGHPTWLTRSLISF